MDAMTRRKFVRYGIGSVVIAVSGVTLGYFLTQQPSQPSTPERLPPKQYEVDRLQVLHIDGVPEIDLGKWTFEVYGEVENHLALSWNQFLELPKIVAVSDFHCVTGWSKFENKWEGVRFSEIVKLARLTKNAKYATIECYGNPVYTEIMAEEVYTTSLPIEDLLHDDVLFAYGLDGKQLAPQYGGPLRLVVPHKYAYKSAKWVRRVKFTQTQELGYWESRGYSNTADPWTDDRYG